MVNLCQICGAYAQYTNYGVLSCASCKVFFRRHGNRKQRYFRCQFNNQCQINVNNRYHCPACRLSKCFELVMSTNLLSAPRNNQLSLIERTCQIQKLPTLNLLQSDQWMLLTNLVTCYQESELLFCGLNLIELHEQYASRENIYRKYVDEFLQLLYRKTGMCISSNGDLRQLPSNERSVCIYSAVENISCLTGAFAIHQCQLYKLRLFRQIMENKYGRRTVDVHLWSGKYFNSNILLTKLATSLYAFSENFSDDFIHSIDMFKIQSKYAEVIWKYLIYKYGYFQAIQHFFGIIMCLCSINVLRYHARNLSLHLNDVDALVEQMELTFILDEAEQILSN